MAFCSTNSQVTIDRDSLEGLPDDLLSMGMRDLHDETGEQSALGVKWGYLY